MMGLDLDLIMHQFSIALGVKPVKQKLPKMHPHVTLLVKDELEKLLQGGFIQVIVYVEWIKNIVLASKHDKYIRVYTYFWDLNKACLKYNFQLSKIELTFWASISCSYFPWL